MQQHRQLQLKCANSYIITLNCCVLEAVKNYQAFNNWYRYGAYVQLLLIHISHVEA